MSIKHLKQNYRRSASNLHKKVGNILRSHPLTKNFKLYQEWPVPNSKYKLDWFLPDLKIAIEVAGQQHERPVAYDGNKDQAKINFVKQVNRDEDKHELIKQAGWKLVELWYDQLDENTVVQKVLQEVLNG